MNCAQYDEEDRFVGMLSLNFYNGFYYWYSNYDVRISFCVRNKPGEEIKDFDNIISDYGENVKPLLNDFEVDIPYIGCMWRSIIRCKDYEKEGAHSLRIPTMVVFNNGDIFIACEAHGDNEEILFRLFSLSFDKGNSFETYRSNISVDEFVYDRKNDRLLGITVNTIYCSNDHGKTWSEYTTPTIKTPDGYESLTTCPTVGVQTQSGILLYPLRAIKWNRDDKNNLTISDETGFVMYSTDYGLTWYQTPTYPKSFIFDEAVLVEYKKNRIMINARGGTEYYWNKTENGRRVLLGRFKRVGESYHFVKTWKFDKKTDGKMWDCLCDVSLIKLDSRNFLYSSPYIPGEYSHRRNLTLFISKDAFRWTPIGILTRQGEIIYGYSSLGADDRDNVYLVYEAKSGIMFSRINPIIANYLN
jgi:hypothetical protein